MTREPRILFLDDSPERAEIFLAKHPSAVWVQTVEECLDLLEQPWDEVHLDHDLGGEVLVDPDRDDCGMAVVRWLCASPRSHLQTTRFLVHTHNVHASCMMVWHLQVMGFHVEECPFGSDAASDSPPGRVRMSLARLLGWLDQRLWPRSSG